MDTPSLFPTGIKSEKFCKTISGLSRRSFRPKRSPEELRSSGEHDELERRQLLRRPHQQPPNRPPSRRPPPPPSPPPTSSSSSAAPAAPPSRLRRRRRRSHGGPRLRRQGEEGAGEGEGAHQAPGAPPPRHHQPDARRAPPVRQLPPPRARGHERRPRRPRPRGRLDGRGRRHHVPAVSAAFSAGTVNQFAFSLLDTSRSRVILTEIEVELREKLERLNEIAVASNVIVVVV